METYIEFRGATSSRQTTAQVVPQGSVLSPSLFSLYVSKNPTPPPGLTLVAYANDCSVRATGNNLHEMCSEMSEYLETVNQWFSSRNLFLFSKKSTVTLFSTWTKEVNLILNLNINGRLLPTVKNQKILGVTFDPLLTFNAHAKTINSRLKQRNNALKVIAGTN